MSLRGIILLSVLIAALQFEAGAQVGQTGLQFLTLGVGGRSIGMGEAYSAIATDPSAMYYNPASLALTSSAQLLLMHKEWFQDTKIEYLAAKAVLGRLTIGTSLNATSVNDIEIRETPGPPQGTFDAHNAAIGFSGAYRLDSSLSIGVTGKYLYEKILVDEANGFAVDLGACYQTPWRVQFAFAVNNLGSMNELGYEATKVPTLVRAGGAYVTPFEPLDGTLTLASDVVTITGENATHLHFGAELNYQQALSVRVGYQTGYDARSISTGIGFRYSQFQFDYAYAPTKYDLGTSHTFSLLIDFN